MNVPPPAGATLVRANNPSPMTLDGTNTWVLVEPGRRTAIVVDPGPADPDHRRAILDAVRAAGAAEIGLVVLTHGHNDHAAGAAELAAHAGAPVRAITAELCVGAPPLVDRERLDVGGLRLDVVATPGHTADSACFVLADDRALLTGDTVLGKGSTVVGHPTGRLADYLASLRTLRALVEERRLIGVLPGHGRARDDPAALIERYLAHRERRLDEVRTAVAAGADTAEAVLRAVYPRVGESLLPAARKTVLAQLAYLRETGEPAPAT